jgi:proline racemase
MRWNRILNVVSAHAEGVKGSVVVGGFGHLPGETVFEKRVYFENELTDLWHLTMREPRGDALAPLNFIVPATDPAAAFGFIIVLPFECPVMSGSNVICVATVLLETGMHRMTEPVTELILEAPVGLIHVRCECKDGKVTRASFLNQPAIAYHLDADIEVGGYGAFKVDVAFGGMTYVLTDGAALGFALVPDEARELVEFGERVKAAAAEQLPVTDPLEPRYPGISQTMLTGPLTTVDGVLTSKNIVVVTPGTIDRCPCGSGTSARLAVMHARNEIAVGQPFVHESIIDTQFLCQVEGTTTVGQYPAVLPRVGGQAWITSTSQVGVDPTDPFPTGFNLGDAWPSLTTAKAAAAARSMGVAGGAPTAYTPG